MPGSYLGIECGATKTTAVLADNSMALLNQVVAGPANLRLLDDGQLQRHFEYLQTIFPRPAAVGVGMAGVRNENDAERVRKVLISLWPGIHFWIGNDLQSAMEAAILCSRYKNSAIARIVVVSGTGSCVYGKTSKGKVIKVGGWGHILGDRGSGYDIAVRSLRLCVQNLDRSGKWPPLGQRMLRALQMNEPNELIDWLNRASKDSVASLAEEVIRACFEKDPLAKIVVTKVAEVLAKDIVACATRMRVAGKRIEIYFNGGILKNSEKLVQIIKKKLSKTLPLCVVSVLSTEGAWGAVSMALKCRVRKENGASPAGRSCPLPHSVGLSPTETRNPKSMDLDQKSTLNSVTLMLNEESAVTEALLRVKNKISKAVEVVSESFRNGGRLFYVGSGTSGRLGILDASECPPTFHTDPEMVQGIIAGGQRAIWSSIEGAEDSFDNGYNSVLYRDARSGDVIVGIAACGKTPFVWGAVKAGLDIGARTIFLCFNPKLRIPRSIKPHILIVADVGPEILTGSTRLKAGTATKIVLNTLTTLSMVRMGRVVSNLMVDLNPANEKLRERAARIVVTLTGCSKEAASKTLWKCNWDVKKSIGMLSNISK